MKKDARNISKIIIRTHFDYLLLCWFIEFGLVLEGQSDHIGRQIDTTHLNVVFGRHEEGRATDTTANIENRLTSLQVEFLAKFLIQSKNQIINQ